MQLTTTIVVRDLSNGSLQNTIGCQFLQSYFWQRLNIVVLEAKDSTSPTQWKEKLHEAKGIFTRSIEWSNTFIAPRID